ncbi:MAG: response regulator [Pseudomonadota bacterium]|nr:response regulator [Pseudomonadota bacterium]
MHAPKYPFAVRLIGFGAVEAAQLCAALTQAPAGGPAYFCLLDDSLQEPDLYIANADDLASLATLSGANPTDITPALLIGAAAPALPFAQLGRPLATPLLHQALAALVRQRAHALAQLSARGLPPLIERRRNPRLDIDLTDPAAHQQRRQQAPVGAILIVDKGGAFRDHVAKVLGARRLPVEWTDSAGTAVRLCDETAVSVLMINTSTPRVDPYRLCADVKQLPAAERTAVVFLVGRSFPYDAPRARAAGVRGLLDKPVADRHLYCAIKKLMSLP